MEKSSKTQEGLKRGKSCITCGKEVERYEAFKMCRSCYLKMKYKERTTEQIEGERTRLRELARKQRLKFPNKHTDRYSSDMEYRLRVLDRCKRCRDKKACGGNKIKVLERDSYTCRECNMPSVSLDVHHIDHNRKNNHLSNLVTLCHTCHGIYHSNKQWNTGLRDSLSFQATERVPTESVGA